jgi:hypothetical protein
LRPVIGLSVKASKTVVTSANANHANASVNDLKPRSPSRRQASRSVMAANSARAVLGHAYFIESHVAAVKHQ